VSGAEDQLLRYVSNSCWHVGHCTLMDDSTFPTPFAVPTFLLDDLVVVADYPVCYCSVDSKFRNLISSI